MLRKFPTKHTQFHRARLISPYFNVLRSDVNFLKDINEFRALYSLGDKKSESYKIPPLLLRQDFWDPNYDSMIIVKSYGDELRREWDEFHIKIESIAEKFKLKNFPYLIKEFILTGRFGDLLFTYSMKCEDKGCTVKISRSIKKKDFMKIWDQIQQYNSEYSINASINQKYSDEILKKYNYIERMNRKYFSDQKDLVLLITQELNGNSDQLIELKIRGWDKSKKSRLNRIVKELFSLLDDLSDAEIW